MAKKISFFTIGCRSNQAETAILKDLVLQKGFLLAHKNGPCDVAVINTCTVTEKSDSDARKLVSKVNRLHPKARIALIGCQAQTQTQELMRWPGVRWVIGNAKKMELADILSENDQGKVVQAIIPAITAESFQLPTPGIHQERTRATMKIQEGCNCFCTFCEVPYARGAARSRIFEDILQEATTLVQAGYQEIVLTGTNIGAYKDRHRKLIDVVRRLNQIKDLARIRISSIEPNTIDNDLVLMMATKTKLCRHLHLPIQSGSDEIIHTMGRNYTRYEIQLFLDFVIHNVPDACLGADVIVGFPGESERHFDETYAFFEDSPIAYFHTFSYSSRKFAKSRDFPSQVNKSIIARRSETLRALSLLKKKSFLKKFIGTCQKVLFEECRENTWQGLTDHYLKVKVKTHQPLQNQIHSVEITSIQNDMLQGIIKG